MIPRNFIEWKKCITVDCKIGLTRDFIANRLAVYGDTQHEETKRFAALYGQAYLRNIIGWFEQAMQEMQR